MRRIYGFPGLCFISAHIELKCSLWKLDFTLESLLRNRLHHCLYWKISSTHLPIGHISRKQSTSKTGFSCSSKVAGELMKEATDFYIFLLFGGTDEPRIFALIEVV